MHLATGEEGFLTDMARQCGVAVRIIHHLEPELSPRNTFNDVRAFREISEWLRDVRPLVVHAHSSKAGGLGRWAAFSHRVPTVFTAHGWGFTDGVPFAQKALMLPAEWAAARITDAIITVSAADLDLAARYRIKPSRLLVAVPNGLAAGADEVAVRPTREEVRVVCVARFSAQKDQALLIDALAGVAEPWRLMLVGDGPLLESVRRHAADAGVADRCDFLGSRDDVHGILSESDIFVLPSNWEGFPITILEAMRSGLPVIASDVGGVREAVVDDETGYLVARGDRAALADALRRTIVDEELRLKLGKAGRDRFLNEFVDAKMYEAVGEVYRRVAGSPPADAGARWIAARS